LNYGFTIIEQCL